MNLLHLIGVIIVILILRPQKEGILFDHGSTFHGWHGQCAGHVTEGLPVQSLSQLLSFRFLLHSPYITPICTIIVSILFFIIPI